MMASLSHVGLALATLGSAGVVTVAVVQATPGTNPMDYGLVGGILLVIVVPVLVWFMRRQDAQAKFADEAELRREKREEARIVNDQNHVMAMQGLASALAAVTASLELIPERVVKAARDAGILQKGNS